MKNVLYILFVYINFANAQDFQKLKLADQAYCNSDLPTTITHLKSCLIDTVYKEGYSYIHLQLGDVFYENGDTNSAIKHYKISLEYDYRPFSFSGKCKLNRYNGREGKSNLSIALGRIYILQNKLDSAETCFQNALNIYKPQYGCANGIKMHKCIVETELINLFLLNEDTLRAEHRLFDLFLISDCSMDYVYNLKRLLKIKYSDQTIKKEVLNAIDHGKFDVNNSRYMSLSFFGHQIKLYVGRFTKLEEYKEYLRNTNKVRILIGEPLIKRPIDTWN